MSLASHLYHSREKIELAEELAATAKENAALRDRVGALECELFWMNTKEAADSKDATRYKWLRDKSEPGICAFYLSVGEAFKGVKFTRKTVDEAIDSQIHTNYFKD